MFPSSAQNTIHIDDLVSVILQYRFLPSPVFRSEPINCVTNLPHCSKQGRNFALNPKEGLKISAFKSARTQAAMADRELSKVGRYLVHMANNHDDFREANHAVS